MKVFFDLSTLHDSGQGHYRQRWDALLSEFPTSPPGHVITFERASADVVIQAIAPQLDRSGLPSLLRPLGQSDVQTLVWDWGDIPTGRLSGLYCSLPRLLFDERRHRTVPYPIIFNELVEHYPLEDARFDFGFVGGVTAGVRRRLFKRFADASGSNTLFRVQAANWSTLFDSSSDGNKRDYCESLRTTRFVLCPRGAGVGSIRFFETLRAGRVPILISDGYVLPSAIDWNNCSLRVRERDIDTIPKLVRESMPYWRLMAANARKVWLANFAPHSLFDYLMGQLADIGLTIPALTLSDRIVYEGKVSAAFLGHHARPLAGKLRHFLQGGSS